MHIFCYHPFQFQFICYYITTLKPYCINFKVWLYVQSPREHCFNDTKRSMGAYISHTQNISCTNDVEWLIKNLGFIRNAQIRRLNQRCEKKSNKSKVYGIKAIIFLLMSLLCSSNWYITAERNWNSFKEFSSIKIQ